MRLLALLSDAPGGRGGIAQYNRDLLTALADCDGGGGTRVCVLPRATTTAAAGAAAGEMPPGIAVQRARGKVRFVAAALRLAIAGGPFDAVFCGHINLAPLAATIARLLRVPLWLQLHGREAWDTLSTAQRWAAERAALVTAVSRHTRRRFLGLCRIDPWRVRVLPNTVRADFAPGAKPDYLLDRLGLRGRKAVLTVGRLVTSERGKGHDRVIAALPEVLAACPAAVYLIVGAGDDRERLARLAQEAGVADDVVFAGSADDTELPDYYRAADLFVMPSVQEGFGIVFLEAAASGLKVIGGSADGSVDALADGEIGRLVDPTDRGALVRAIIDALRDAAPRAPAGVERFRFANFAAHARALRDGLLRPGPQAMTGGAR